MENETTSPEQISSDNPTTETETPMVTEGETDATPEILYAGKYTSTSELEKAYEELHSTFSKKMGSFVGTPEEGYVLPEGELSPVEEGLVEFAKIWGAENQLSNDGLVSLIQSYSEYESQMKEATIKQAYNDLGENAETRLTNIRDFFTSNLGEENTQALAGVLNSAKAIEAIEVLINMSKSPSVTTQNTEVPVNADKVREMRFKTDENGNRLMSIDPTYRDKVLKAEASLIN